MTCSQSSRTWSRMAPLGNSTTSKYYHTTGQIGAVDAFVVKLRFGRRIVVWFVANDIEEEALKSLATDSDRSVGIVAAALWRHVSKQHCYRRSIMMRRRYRNCLAQIVL